MWFKCYCEKDSKPKQYFIKNNTIKNIIQQIKKCKYCTVNIDFHAIIYQRAGISEAEILIRKTSVI